MIFKLVLILCLFTTTVQAKDLTEYVNTVHQTKDIIIATGTLDFDRKRNLFKELLLTLNETQIDSYTELACLTSQIESNGGLITKQVKGTALSEFQIEPSTHVDLLNRVVVKGPAIWKEVLDEVYWYHLNADTNLEFNTAYSFLLTYFKYKSLLKETKLPESTDIFNLIAIYKKYFNTYKGSTKISDALYKTMNVR